MEHYSSLITNDGIYFVVAGVIRIYFSAHQKNKYAEFALLGRGTDNECDESVTGQFSYIPRARKKIFSYKVGDEEEIS